MLTHEQTKTAYELLAQADAAFGAGDLPLGASHLWDAYADTINTIAQQRGVPCRDDDDIRLILKELAADESEHQSLLTSFYTATRFRDAAARGRVKSYEVEFLYPEVPLIVNELAVLA